MMNYMGGDQFHTNATVCLSEVCLTLTSLPRAMSDEFRDTQRHRQTDNIYLTSLVRAMNDEIHGR